MKFDNPAFDYDRLGQKYSGHRKTDPRIAEYVFRELTDAKTVLNVGSGAGSYEPTDKYVVAVEPSVTIRQLTGITSVLCQLCTRLKFKKMQKRLLSILIFLTYAANSFSQTTVDVVGKWRISEMISDRVYKNFENDSIYFFDKEDQLKYESGEVKKNMNDAFDMFRDLAINFNNDNTFSFDFMGDLEKGTYRIIPKHSQLIITNMRSSKSDTLNLKLKGVIEYDLSDEYEKQIFTFKRISN